MNIQTGGKVSGVYGIKVLRNAGTDNEFLEDFGESPNMLLDGFFDRFASGNLSATSWYMYVGSGAAPAEATQTQLVSQVGNYTTISASENDNIKIGNDYVASSTGVAGWAIGDIVGNISEIGVRLGSIIGSTVDSRALITDAQGNPTAITVTAEDRLLVNYTLKYIIPIQHHVSSVDFLGVPTTCTLERVAVLDKGRNSLRSAFDVLSDLFLGSTNAIINNPEETGTSGMSNEQGKNVVKTSSGLASGMKRQSFKFSTSDGNLSGGAIGSVGITQAAFAFHFAVVHFDPPIPKDSTKTLTLNFDFTLTRA